LGRAGSLSVYARRELADCSDSSPALLLEGDWPSELRSSARHSLDDLFDVRHAWIDVEAARLAEVLAERGLAAGRKGWLPWLDNLKLRYFLVRLVRVVAYFAERQELGHVRFHSSGPRDADYALLLAEICQQRGIELEVHRHGNEPARRPPAMPANPPHRQLAGRLAAFWGSWPLRQRFDASAPRVLLCGNPSLLDPLCSGLVAQGSRVAWLWDRFPLKWWRTWRGRVEPLVCDAANGKQNGMRIDTWGPIDCRGFDLAEPVRHWLGIRAESYGAWQTRLVERIERHLDRFRPSVLVLDEDSTPTARAAVAVAREQGIGSIVLQHGAPCVRFGYSPLAADRICVWGEASRQRFIDWGVPAERIRVTGSPKHDELLHGQPTARTAATKGLRVLVLGTLPPEDDRPDSVALHFTSETHRGMLRAAFGGLGGIAGVQIVLKLHPRLASDQVFWETLAEFPPLNAQFVRGGDLAAMVSDCDVVLSCASSAGLEAAWWGRPVIEILPIGSEVPFPAALWGQVGMARTGDEVASLVAQCRAPHEVVPSPLVFANLERPAVEAILEEIAELAGTPLRQV